MVINEQVIMKIQDKELLNRFTISLYDFEEAKRFLDKAQKYKTKLVPYEALLIAAIIYFARPFSVNEQNKNSKAASKIDIKWFSINSAEKVLYDSLITLRNKCIAHAEYQYYPTSVNGTGVIRSRRFTILDSHIDIKAFVNLLDNFINQAHNKRADYTSDLKKGRGKPSP